MRTRARDNFSQKLMFGQSIPKTVKKKKKKIIEWQRRRKCQRGMKGRERGFEGGGERGVLFCGKSGRKTFPSKLPTYIHEMKCVCRGNFFPFFACRQADKFLKYYNVSFIVKNFLSWNLCPSFLLSYLLPLPLLPTLSAPPVKERMLSLFPHFFFFFFF